MTALAPAARQSPPREPLLLQCGQRICQLKMDHISGTGHRRSPDIHSLHHNRIGPSFMGEFPVETASVISMTTVCEFMRTP